MIRIKSASKTVLAPSGRAKFRNETPVPKRAARPVDSAIVNSWTSAVARCGLATGEHNTQEPRNNDTPTPVPAIARLVRTYASHVRSFAK